MPRQAPAGGNTPNKLPPFKTRKPAKTAGQKITWEPAGMLPTIFRPESRRSRAAWKGGCRGCREPALRPGWWPHLHEEKQSDVHLNHRHDRDHSLRARETVVVRFRATSIQITPRLCTGTMPRRRNRDGRKRCHSRQRTGLPSSDGPGSQSSQRGLARPRPRLGRGDALLCQPV